MFRVLRSARCSLWRGASPVPARASGTGSPAALHTSLLINASAKSVASWCPPYRGDPITRFLEHLLPPTQLGKGSNPDPPQNCPLSGLWGRQLVFLGQCHHAVPPRSVTTPSTVCCGHSIPLSSEPAVAPCKTAARRWGQSSSTFWKVSQCQTPPAPAGWHLQVGRVGHTQVCVTRGCVTHRSVTQGCVTQGCLCVYRCV